MTVRAPTAAGDGRLGARTAADPSPLAAADGDPLLAPTLAGLSAEDARLWRAIVAPILDSARAYAHRARQRANLAGTLAERDARASYANGAADCALAAQLTAADSIARAIADR